LGAAFLRKERKLMSELVEAAKRWAEQGLKIVPLKLSVAEDGSKRVQPLYKWQTEPYPKFDKLNWAEANAYAIILGETEKGWLACVDVDVDAPVRQDAFTTLVRAFPELQDTYIEKTPRGFHFFAFIDKPENAGNINAKNQYGLELHVNGLAITAPSSYEGGSYNVYHEAKIAKIPDFYERFVQKFATPSWFNLAEKPKGYKGPEPPCIRALLKGVEEGLRNEVGIRLVSYFLNFKGLPKNKALALLEGWNNRNKPPLPQSEINNILKSAEVHGYIFGCNDELLSRFCNEDECPFAGTEETKAKIIHTPSAELPDGRLIEEAFDGKDVFYLVYNPTTGQVEKAKTVEVEGVAYKPVDNPEVRYGLTLLPSEAVDYGSDEQLFKEILEFLNKWHDQPNESERKLDVLYIFLTYVYDLLPRLPYRRAWGKWGRGKSAWLDAVGSICYRPVILAGCDTDKAIVRRMNNWKGTALIDEADFSNSSLYAFIIKILNISYDKRLGFYQRSDEINPMKTLVYNVYGPKLLATRQEFKDKALESRCLTFIAFEKGRPMPLFRYKKFLEETQALRNKLIMWRFRKYYDLKAKIESLETPQIDIELNISSSRVKETVAPLLLVAPEFKDEISKLAVELEEQLKATDPDWQLENEFIEALNRILEAENVSLGSQESLPRGAENASLEDYQEKKVILKVPLVKIAKLILDEPNPEEDKLKVLNRKLSQIARSNLGLKVVRGSKNRKFVEVPWPFLYMRLSRLQRVTLQTVKIVELDDKHPLEKQQPIIVSGPTVSPEESEKRVKVWNALAEASITRGSAFLDELVQATGLPESEVKAVLEQFQKEGKAYSPYPDAWKISQLPEKAQVKVVAWFGLTAKITSWQAWKATEQLHWLKRNLQLELEFPDNTKIRVTGALTWFLAKLKAVELFGEWRKKLNLTRDSTLPICIGAGKPIPPNRCEDCHKHSDYTCEQLKQGAREYFKKFIQIKYRCLYADIYVYLCETPFRLTSDGQRALWLLVFRYITNHRENKRIYSQYFAIADDYAAFSVVSSDMTNITEAILDILEKPENTKRVGRVFP
jgi:hypothetical protein